VERMGAAIMEGLVPGQQQQQGGRQGFPQVPANRSLYNHRNGGAFGQQKNKNRGGKKNKKNKNKDGKQQQDKKHPSEDGDGGEAANGDDCGPALGCPTGGLTTTDESEKFIQ